LFVNHAHLNNAPGGEKA